MTQGPKPLPTWILIVSAIFAFMELTVSIFMFVSPETVGDNVDLTAKGVVYLISIWASRQFALGFILAYATIKRSYRMLTISYIFLFVMFVGDLMIGISQHDNALITSAVVMCLIAGSMLVVFHKIKPKCLDAG